MLTDDSGMSCEGRQRKIDEWAELVVTGGTNNILTFSGDRTVLILYPPKGHTWATESRLGVVRYNERGEGTEYLFRREGLEGARNAETFTDGNGHVTRVERAAAYRECFREELQRLNLPPVLQALTVGIC